MSKIDLIKKIEEKRRKTCFVQSYVNENKNYPRSIARISKLLFFI